MPVVSRGIKGGVRGVPVGKGGRPWGPSGQGCVRGVPWGQGWHFDGPLMICKAPQVILRVLLGQQVCQGDPSGHGVDLMGFLMNHEAYMPVYKWSRAWRQLTKQPTDPRAGLTWTVKNLTFIRLLQLFWLNLILGKWSIWTWWNRALSSGLESIERFDSNTTSLSNFEKGR